MSTLKLPPINPLDSREQRAIDADCVMPCKCGEMPLGVEFVSELTVGSVLDPMGAYVRIKCPNGCLEIGTETPEHAVWFWNSEREKAAK